MRVMRRAALAAAVLALWMAPRGLGAVELSKNPEMSFFAGFALGTGLDPAQGARRSLDGRTAYGAGGFLFGLDGGFRFNEIIGVSIGLTQSRHPALERWGGAAGYTLGHVALRLAIPTPTRLTMVWECGPAVGEFFYGAVEGAEENGTLTVGGLGGIVFEYELGSSVVALIGIEYRPLWRRRMGTLYLTDEDPYSGTGPELVDVMDLGDSRIVHLVWIRFGLQFEWVIP